MKQTLFSRILKIILALMGFLFGLYLLLTVLFAVHRLIFLTPCMANINGLKLVIGSILSIFIRCVIAFLFVFPISYDLFKKAVSRS